MLLNEARGKGEWGTRLRPRHCGTPVSCGAGLQAPDSLLPGARPCQHSDIAARVQMAFPLPLIWPVVG